MSVIARRLSKLEDRVGGTGRLIVVFAYSEMETSAAAQFVQSQGLALSDRDELATFTTIYEDQDGLPIDTGRPPEIVSVHSR